MLRVFQTAEEESKLDHFRNLIAMTKVDEDIDRAERGMLYKVGEKYGYARREVDQMIEATSKDRVLVVSQAPEARFDQLYDLVQVMLADGVVDQHEIDHCRSMAEQLGVRHENVGPLVRRMMFGIVEGTPEDEILEAVAPMLGLRV